MGQGGEGLRSEARVTDLADPRSYGVPGGEHELAHLALQACRGDSAAAVALRALVHQSLVAADDATLHAALSHAP